MAPAFDLLSFVVRSENRVDALLALAAGPATRSKLQDDTDIPRATLSRILADFRDRDLVDRHGYEFSITPLGRLLARELRALFRSLEVAGELQSLAPWLPLSELDIDILDLADARVTAPTSVDPLAPVRRTAEVLAASDRVRGLCNNVVPELLTTLSDAVIEDDLQVEVIVTADAVEAISADPSVSGVVLELLGSGQVDISVWPGGIPQLAIDADGTVLLEVTDDQGAIKGLVESEDGGIRSWFESTFDRYRRDADWVAPEVLAS